MEINFTSVQARVPVTIIGVVGALDSSSAGYFNEQIRQVIDQGADDILLDFSQVPFMGSVGIRSLSAAYDWLHPVHSVEERKAISQAVHDGTYHAPHLKLLNPNQRIQNTIRLVALDRYLEIFHDREQALAAF
jgi:STAS domain